MLLNQRTRKLTYPRWSLAQLRSIRVPKRAARHVIDRAAALAIGIHADRVAEWRRRLAAEPTITNEAVVPPRDRAHPQCPIGE